MNSRGPLPNPKARRRNKRPAANGRVLIARPAMPRDMTGEARAEWRRVVPEIEAMGMLAKVDRSILIRYCTAWADWHELDVTLKTSGRLVRGSHGEPIRNPLWRMRNEAEQILLELGRQLGLTPVARIRAGVKHEEPAPPETDANKPTVLEVYRARLAAASES